MTALDRAASTLGSPSKDLPEYQSRIVTGVPLALSLSQGLRITRSLLHLGGFTSTVCSSRSTTPVLVTRARYSLAKCELNDGIDRGIDNSYRCAITMVESKTVDNFEKIQFLTRRLYHYK